VHVQDARILFWLYLPVVIKVAMPANLVSNRLLDQARSVLGASS